MRTKLFPTTEREYLALIRQELEDIKKLLSEISQYCLDPFPEVTAMEKALTEESGSRQTSPRISRAQGATRQDGEQDKTE